MANLKVHHPESDDLMIFPPILQRKMAVLNIHHLQLWFVLWLCSITELEKDSGSEVRGTTQVLRHGVGRVLQNCLQLLPHGLITFRSSDSAEGLGGRG